VIKGEGVRSPGLGLAATGPHTSVQAENEQTILRRGKEGKTAKGDKLLCRDDGGMKTRREGL